MWNRNILSELDVQCPNRNHGCKEIFKYAKLDDHLALNCPFQKIECPKNKACGCQLLRKDLPVHMDEECKLCKVCPCCNNKILCEDSEHTECLFKIRHELDEAKTKLNETKDKMKLHMGMLRERELLLKAEESKAAKVANKGIFLNR